MKERSLHRGLNARYLEDGEDDDEGGVSLNDLKKEYKQKRGTLSYKDEIQINHVQ